MIGMAQSSGQRSAPAALNHARLCVCCDSSTPADGNPCFSHFSLRPRVGYGAFPLAIAEVMWRAKQPYNVTVASEVAALAALSNGTYINVGAEFAASGRERGCGVSVCSGGGKGAAGERGLAYSVRARA